MISEELAVATIFFLSLKDSSNEVLMATLEDK